MVLGLMISSVATGQIIAKTGRYGIFPVTGTLIVALGYVIYTFLHWDTPFWYLCIGMFVTGLGFGQLMQSLTLATQSAVEARDMGVATSASQFFRQIGGTLGTAVLLSVLFTAMGPNITTAMGDKADLTAGLDAALDPAVAGAANNAGVMEQIWTPIVDPVRASAPGIDWTNADQRSAVVEKAVPTIIDRLESGDGAQGASTDATSDTSFLVGADPVLAKPFLVGFTSSAVTVYWVGLAAMALAFILSLFFRPPPLRQRSALQEAADDAAAAAGGADAELDVSATIASEAPPRTRRELRERREAPPA